MAYVAVALGGFVGAILRYGIGQWMGAWTGVNVATSLVNLFGCFALGWLNSVSLKRLPIRPHVKLALGTGLLGAFTTFSTFTVEGLQLFQNSHFIQAVGYAVISIAGGLFCSYLGFRLATIGTKCTASVPEEDQS